MIPETPPTLSLKRELGVWGATLMGLGSIVGTGVFVSLGIAAGIAGPSVIVAIAMAAALAACNALNSAQLAASHPVSGGAYEYGYRFLTPSLGFTAGWMFLAAKIASAATAGLGFAGYLLQAAGGTPEWKGVVAAGTVVALTSVLLLGIRRSNAVNAAIVAVTLASLAAFVAAGAAQATARGAENLTPFFGGAERDAGLATYNLLQAAALMFVAFTGYGRIATLGEEVRDPKRTIPRAIIATVVVASGLYIAVAVVGVAAVGAEALGAATEKEAAPLAVAAQQFGGPLVSRFVAVGAMTAMLGVMLNLLLGLSRVLLAMGRRGDMPRMFATVSESGSPWPATLATGAAILPLVLLGNVKTAWSFSAFTVLIYYAINNLAAMKLPTSERLYPRVLAWAGLAGCLFLAFWVEWRIWLAGLVLIAVGFGWRWVVRKLTDRSRSMLLS